MGAGLTAAELGKWWSCQTEKAPGVAQMIASWGQMRNILLIHGGFHGVAVATAAQSPVNAGGQMPVYCAAPMRQDVFPVNAGSLPPRGLG